MSVESDFFSKMLPYAQEASGKINHMYVSEILAQWANESDYGRSNLAVNALNFGGITYVEGASIAAGSSGNFAMYDSINQFVDDYARVMNLSYYDSVRSAGTLEDSVKALGESPYAGSHYGGHGEWIQTIIDQNGLTAYDGASGSFPGGFDANIKNMAAIGAAFVALLALAGVGRG